MSNRFIMILLMVILTMKVYSASAESPWGQCNNSR